MKLPRWLIIVVLTISTVVAPCAAGWWWITWPDRTVREFGRLLAAGRWWEATELVHRDERGEDLRYRMILLQLRVAAASDLQLAPRSIADGMLARRRFHIPASPVTFTAERGQVRWAEPREQQTLSPLLLR